MYNYYPSGAAAAAAGLSSPQSAPRRHNHYGGGGGGGQPQRPPLRHHQSFNLHYHQHRPPMPPHYRGRYRYHHSPENGGGGGGPVPPLPRYYGPYMAPPSHQGRMQGGASFGPHYPNPTAFDVESYHLQQQQRRLRQQQQHQGIPVKRHYSYRQVDTNSPYYKNGGPNPALGRRLLPAATVRRHASSSPTRQHRRQREADVAAAAIKTQVLRHRPHSGGPRDFLHHLNNRSDEPRSFPPVSLGMDLEEQVHLSINKNTFANRFSSKQQQQQQSRSRDRRKKRDEEYYIKDPSTPAADEHGRSFLFQSEFLMGGAPPSRRGREDLAMGRDLEFCDLKGDLDLDLGLGASAGREALAAKTLGGHLRQQQQQQHVVVGRSRSQVLIYTNTNNCRENGSDNFFRKII